LSQPSVFKETGRLYPHSGREYFIKNRKIVFKCDIPDAKCFGVRGDRANLNLRVYW